MMDTLKSSVVLIQYQDYLPSSHRLISITLVTCNTSNPKATEVDLEKNLQVPMPKHERLPSIPVKRGESSTTPV